MKILLTLYRKIALGFIRQDKGAIVIEAAFTLAALIIFIAMVIDLGTAFIMQSRLERATYTAATVFRERIALYEDKKPASENINTPITQAEVTQLREIVSQLLSETDLVVMVEELRFKPVDSSTNPVKPEIERLNEFSAPGNARCKSKLPTLASRADLSPWTSRNRWLPLYRVTVCMPGSNSWYKSLVNSNSGIAELTVEELIAFNIVIPR